MAETKNLLLFRKWDLSDIEVKDPGLKTAISLRKQILPYTYGRSALKRFNKADVNIVERLINKSMHFGKKYAKNTGRMTGKKTKLHLVKTIPGCLRSPRGHQGTLRTPRAARMQFS